MYRFLIFAPLLTLTSSIHVLQIYVSAEEDKIKTTEIYISSNEAIKYILLCEAQLVVQVECISVFLAQ